MAEQKTQPRADKEKDKLSKSLGTVHPVIYQIPFPDSEDVVSGHQRTPCYRDQFPATNLSQEIALIHACCTSEVAVSKRESIQNKDHGKHPARSDGKVPQRRNADVEEMKPNVCSRHEVKLGKASGDESRNYNNNNTNNTYRRLAAKDHRYTDIYKASLKLKGLSIENIFAKDRSHYVKPRIIHDSDHDTGRMKPNDDGKADDWRHISLPGVKLPNELAIEALGDGSSRSNAASDLDGWFADNGSSTDRSDNRKHPFVEDNFPSRRSPRRAAHNRAHIKRFPHAISNLMDRYENTPGRKAKCKTYGRKLGNVVSSKRLHQLLDSEQPLKMESFYNYYLQ